MVFLNLQLMQLLQFVNTEWVSEFSVLEDRDKSTFENTFFPGEKKKSFQMSREFFFQTSKTLLTFQSSLSLLIPTSSFQRKRKKNLKQLRSQYQHLQGYNSI